MDKKSGTILITGVTGLVGARLVPRLLKEGWNCRVLIRAGKDAPEGVTAIEGDLLEESTLAAAVKDITAVIHLAALFRTEDMELIWKTNLEGTRNLIHATKAYAPNARFIMASTAHVYNADKARPGREEDITEPQHPYPASKVAAEKYLRESGLNWSVLRFPFVYGDGDGHLDMLYTHELARKRHPASRMTVIHHRDIATAMYMALEGIMDGRIVNIGDEAPASMYELVQLAGGTIAPSAEPLQHPWGLQSDISLARSLGFRPVVRTVYQAAQENIL